MAGSQWKGDLQVKWAWLLHWFIMWHLASFTLGRYFPWGFFFIYLMSVFLYIFTILYNLSGWLHIYSKMCWVKCETLLFALWTHFLMQFWPMTYLMPLEIKWNVTDLIIWAYFFFSNDRFPFPVIIHKFSTQTYTNQHRLHSKLHTHIINRCSSC